MTDAPDTDSPFAARSPEQALAYRLESLEKDNTRLRRLGTYLVILVGVLLGLAAAIVVVAVRHGMPGMVPQVVESHKFLLRDGDGRVRGVWGAGDDGAIRLILQDQNGKPRLRMNLLADGSSGITFADSADKPRLVIGVLPDETSTLVFGDRLGNTRAALGLSQAGSASLVFADRSGVTRAGLGVDTRGLGTFTLFDRAGGTQQPDDSASDTTAPDSVATPPTR